MEPKAQDRPVPMVRGGNRETSESRRASAHKAHLSVLLKHVEEFGDDDIGNDQDRFPVNAVLENLGGRAESLGEAIRRQ